MILKVTKISSITAEGIDNIVLNLCSDGSDINDKA